MKKILFVDRDGTLIIEPSLDKQVDSLEKLQFIPGMITALRRIVHETDYRLVMVSNQDGLGTDSFPIADFLPPHRMLIDTLAGEGITFDEILIDESFPDDLSPRRKPGIGMVEKYMNDTLDYANSYVIGDRRTDMQLADNMGIRRILYGEEAGYPVDFSSTSWNAIADFLIKGSRKTTVTRTTTETKLTVSLDLNRSTPIFITTGIGFFDHMLTQIAEHAEIALSVQAVGDLHVDEHHTIEDVGIVLGETFKKALGSKKGIQRYGFVVPMDESQARVALDFGGRPYLVSNVEFKGERIGDFPTQMFEHFWYSFCQGAGCTLHIEAFGQNDHHKAEAVFKAFARTIRQAIAIVGQSLPSSKGML